MFDGLTYGDYFIKESKAPSGYQLSDEVVKVTIDDTWVNGNDKLRTIIYPARPLPISGGPGTGDTTDPVGWIILIGISVIGIFGIRKRKNENL